MQIKLGFTGVELNTNPYISGSMGCKKLNTDFFNFLEIVHSKKSASEEKKRINYYPFGLKHKGYNNVTSGNVNSVASKFKYNGVELEESLGLNLYEMELRLYDPAIARWNAIDPVTHYEYSTYSAFDNNPVFWADPSGADSEVSEDGNVITFTGQDAQDFFRDYIQNNTDNSAEGDDSADDGSSSDNGGGDSNTGNDNDNEKTPSQKRMNRLRKDSSVLCSNELPNTSFYLNGESVILDNGKEYVLWGNKWIETPNLDKEGNLISKIKVGSGRRSGSMTPKQYAVMRHQMSDGNEKALLDTAGVSSAPALYSWVKKGFSRFNLVVTPLTFAQSKTSTYLSTIESMNNHDKIVSDNRK